MRYLKNNLVAIVGLIYVSIKLYEERNKHFSDPDNMSPVYLVAFIPLLIFLILIYFKYYFKK